MSNQHPDSDRRRFLLQTTAAALAAGASGTLDACGGGGTDAGRDTATGPTDSTFTVADVAVGDCRTTSTLSFFVARDMDGFFAYTNICSHEACPVPCPDAMGVSTCSCTHGSTYNRNGDLLTPATTRPVRNQGPLVHYVVSFMGTGPTARIFVDTGMIVTTRTTRTPPPA